MDFLTLLDSARSQLQDSLSAEFLALIQRAVDELEASGITQRSLQVGDRIPDFTLCNTADQPIDVHKLLSQGSVVISFFRGMWCPFCSLELQALEQVFPAIQALGVSLIAISPQTQSYSLAMAERHNLTFNILSDRRNGVARQFGLVHQVPGYLRPVFEQMGLPLPRYNGDESFELPIPATYIVGQDGIILYAFVNPDYTQRVDPVEIVTILRRNLVCNR